MKLVFAFLLLGGVLYSVSLDEPQEQRVYLNHCPTGWYVSENGHLDDEIAGVDYLVMRCDPAPGMPEE